MIDQSQISDVLKALGKELGGDFSRPAFVFELVSFPGCNQKLFDPINGKVVVVFKFSPGISRNVKSYLMLSFTNSRPTLSSIISPEGLFSGKFPFFKLSSQSFIN